MKKKLLKEIYSVEKKISDIFTGHRLDFNKTGHVLISPSFDCLNFVDLRTGQKVHEIKSAEQRFQVLAGVDDTKGESIITFAFDQLDNHLVVAYSSGLLRYWSINISEKENHDQESSVKVEHILLRSWKSLHVGPIASILFDVTRSLVATGGSDGTIKLWNLVQNYCTHNLKEAKGVIQTLRFAPTFTEESYHLLASGDDYAINVWNLIDSKHVASLEGHQNKITEIIFTPDGQRFISASRDKLVMIWNAKTFAKEKTIAVFESIETMILVPLKKLHVIDRQKQNKTCQHALVVAGESGLLKIWDYHQGKLLLTQTRSLLAIEKKKPSEETEATDSYPEHSQYTQINQLIYNSHLDQIVAVSYDKDIIFHNISDLQPTRQLVGSNDEVLDLKLIGSKQSHVAIATNSPKIKIFEIQTSNCSILVGHTDIVLALAVFPHDPYLMVSSSKDNSVRLWRFSRENCQLAICLFRGTGHTHSVTSLSTSMSLDGSFCFFLSGSEDTTLKFWKLPEKINEFNENQLISNIKAQYTQSCHEKTINSIDVSPNDQLMATGSQDKTAKLWALPNLKLLATFRGHRKGIWCVKFSPIDQILATCSADTTIKIWSITNQMSCLKTFQGHTSVLKLGFLDEGMQFLTSSSDGNIKIWSLRSNECTATFDAHEGKVWAMTFSNDEEMLVTGGDDSTIAIWRNQTAEVREKEALKVEELVQNEQTLQNLLHRKSWFKALKLAIRFEHPLRCLTILKEIILEKCGNLDSVCEDLAKLRRDQILTLFEYSIHWNTNSKHWLVAHCVIRVLFNIIPSEELLQMSDFRAKVEKLLPYCDRHQARLVRLRQYITFADFVYEQMKLPD